VGSRNGKQEWEVGMESRNGKQKWEAARIGSGEIDKYSNIYYSVSTYIFW
jgi:hypothetical protein